MTLEPAIGADKFTSDIDGIDAFINKEFPLQEKEYVWEEPYRGLPYSPDMDDLVDQENNEKSVDAYDQFVGAKVFLPDERGRKMMARVTNRVKYNNGNPRGIEQPILFADHPLYEVSFPNVKKEYLTENVISENMILQVDSE